MATKKLDPLERLLLCGEMLSNLAFNLAQSNRLDDRVRESARDGVSNWDNALREYRALTRLESKPKKRPK